MYELYKQKLNSENPVSKSVYRREFLDHNLKFKKPRVDTCKTCDSFNYHQDIADCHYEYKRRDKEMAANAEGMIVVAVCDLQQCLPTPDLTSSISFYKRKLWTSELLQENFCYVWYEGIAQRGSNEIASCLMKFLMDLSESVECVIIYSNTSSGQNRNMILPLMYNTVLQRKEILMEIRHKYLVPGHTHLECDVDHALIERARKSHNGTVVVPQYWMMVVRMPAKHFTVIPMGQINSFSFSILLKDIFVNRTVDTENTSFLGAVFFGLQITKDYGIFQFKYSLNIKEPFGSCSVRRKGRQSDESSHCVRYASEDSKEEM
ncbi:hypothetical protein PR048_015221 [Dryococelus australis]|uniref:DUF7869 domain-containing protein n=1 Tax=Dryococelus australis TaxID=614101 RepID=A0ABQ9HGC0_9NEOP|nr:hypothetical protein PR048_015221 [Dryococelus australis]